VQLEGDSEAVNQVEGLEEEGAHRMELSMTVWIGDGNLVVAARTASHRHRLGVRRGAQ
jgi:hypothetical protein